ncbi:prepilin-type N-terminal cleavage/methylation domain-containing protein [Chamaesiphon sp. VAR_48_metabat_135_sub]|uniref:pilus assembly FimT family protein n=1 Tax=Chamaesiphon sp. VAR_48_metabat_135_sub TaxID=2964699 RepID=UPI00286B863F|nr:prepilin-type N-terminal cleavage/methylation domain-containing protein [Chamaesiphon sp. VAR_48_metabat_135_sub]
MAIRPPKYNSQGYTLLEMLAVVMMAGIVMGFAVPSLLSLNKPLRDGSLQFKSHLSLIRSKAISSNQAYRISPKYTTRAGYVGSIPNQFIVEYAANCKVTALGAANNGWETASQFDLDLPLRVGITEVGSTTVTVPGTGAVPIDNLLNWNICFDNRGIVDTTKNIILKDFQSGNAGSNTGNNTAKIAAVLVGKVGIVEIFTYGSNTTVDLNDGQSTPQPIF